MMVWKMKKRSKANIFMQARRIRGSWGGAEAPQIFANVYFSWIEKSSFKVKNSTNLKTSWNFSKVFDISIITFDLNTRDSILSVISCERFSRF